MTLIVSSAMIMVMDNTKGKKQKQPETYTPDRLSKLKLKPEKKPVFDDRHEAGRQEIRDGDADV